METFKGCLVYIVAGVLLLGGAYFGIQKWASNDEAKKEKAQKEALDKILATPDGYRKKMVVAKLKPKVEGYQGSAVILTGIIDNKGDRGGNDGIVSRSDLEWAAENLDGDTARAAQWLLDHPEFFTAVETAKHNDDYLRDRGAGFAADDGSNVRILLDDVDGDPFMNKFAAWPFR